LRGKVCVITGGTDGIGKAAAHGLALQGATLLIHGRDADKGARAVAELKAGTGNAAIEFLQADFGSLADVRRLAGAIAQRAPRIDVLVNNAGAVFAQRTLSADGYELTFAVNHLAPFLLTKLLLPALQHGGAARIVTTSSEAHRRAKLDLDDVHSARRYSPMAVYGASKLANILFTRVLATRLAGSAVTATCLHPGFVKTSFGRGFEASPLLGALFSLIARFARTPEKGAETVVYLAASPDVAGASGGYYFDRAPKTPSAAAQDAAAAERLWQLSERFVGAVGQ
jgi:NAD(P)-dependent dehydrogenase (short-subunit alcohol dehydrogenase family)